MNLNSPKHDELFFKIMALGVIFLFICSAAFAINKIYIMPDGYGPLTASANPPPLVYDFKQVIVLGLQEHLIILLVLLSTVLVTLFVLFLNGVKDNNVS